MKKDEYNSFLSRYDKGTRFEIVTDRGNGRMSSEATLNYSDKAGIIKPELEFDGGAVFNPRLVGGIENGVISLKPLFNFSSDKS
ncbi:Uncharacterised protein [uncultured archaeon]|nr:Uncharacterised protein [uncultured archaeon]